MRCLLLLPVILPLLTSAAVAQPSVPAQSALARMTDSQRRLSLHQSITEQGNACSAVTAGIFGGRDSAGDSYWDARCEGGNNYRMTLTRVAADEPGILTCGAHLPGPTGGPCFQTAYASVIGAIPGAPGGPRVLYGRPEVMLEARCVASCASGPINGISACTSVCLQRGDTSAPAISAVGASEIIRSQDLALQAHGAGEPEGLAERIQANLGFTAASQRQGQRRWEAQAAGQRSFTR